MEKIQKKQEQAFKEGTDYQFATKKIELGPWTSFSLLNDPIHMCFVLSRYKFCAKMLKGKKRILEIGCGDAFGIPIAAQNAEYILGIDVDDRLIEDNKIRLEELCKRGNIEFRKMNICEEYPNEKFDAAFSIDVIEHLDENLDNPFMENTCSALKNNGVCIVGTPNITARKYATKRSAVQHINLKSHKTLKELMGKYFKNVFMFSMNDEVVHTGYEKMAHYIFGVGTGKK